MSPEDRAEYDALVVQVASWCMRRAASDYIPVTQGVQEFAAAVMQCTGDANG